MSFQSVKLKRSDGTMHHLGIDETMVAPKVIITPDPLQIPEFATFLDKAEKVGHNREYVTYTGFYHGERISVMSCGTGCMPVAIAIEELNHLGVREVIKIDCCPAIQKETKVGTLFAASGAVRGEFASREYVDVSYPAVADMELLERLLSCGVSQVGIFRSHDCVSLETPWAFGGPERIEKWTSLGVDVIDGETSAMFVVASILGLKTASLAVITENYITGEKADAQSLKKQLFCIAADALVAR